MVVSNTVMRWRIKPLVIILCLIPLALLAFDALSNNLGANPIEKITRRSGDWALRMLLITLAITPMRILLQQPWLLRLRRMLGLFAFFYACLHITSYVVLDQYFAWADIVKDIIKRPFITVGFIAFILLIPLALTSTNNMIKRLGAVRWQRLHKLVYLIACLGVLHYFWMVKADIRSPLLHATILAILLGYRLWLKRKLLVKQRLEVGNKYPSIESG